MPRFILLMCFVPAFASAQELTIDAFPEGVRFDPKTGRAIEGGDPLPREPLKLNAARDEVVSFQLRLRGETPQTLTVRAAELAPGITPEVFVEMPVDVKSISESGYVNSLGPASYPDILIPTTTISVPAAPAIAMVFVDIFVPRKAEPGTFKGALQLGKITVPIELEVLPFVLPEKDFARLGAVSFGSLLQRNADSMRRWMQIAHAHHLTIELMKPTPPIDDATKAIDWDVWARRFAEYLEGTAFTEAAGYRGPRAGLPVTRFVVPLAEWWPSRQRSDGLLPEDGALWSRALGEWEKEVEKRGWFAGKERADWVLFINALDEAKTAEKMEAIKAYGPLIDAAKLSDRTRLLFRVDGIFHKRAVGWPDSRKVEELGDAVVDIWNMHGATDTAPIQLVEPRRAKGERAQFYASLSGGEAAIPPLVVDSAIAGARAWGWIVARYRLDGALNWEFDFKEGCVENPKCSEGGVMNLDALLAYRGEEVGRAPDHPFPSMRLKALRRGAQDVALLAVLEAKDPARAEEILKRMVPVALGEAKGTKGAWPKDQVFWEHARAEIIARLKGEEPPPPPTSGRFSWQRIAAAVVAVLILIVVLLSFRGRKKPRS